VEQHKRLMPEEWARITEIQDLLLDRYVEQKEALDEGNRCRAIKLESKSKSFCTRKRGSSSG